MNSLSIGICQMRVVNDKNSNLNKAEEMINDVVSKGAKLVVLPEMFNCPYNNKYFSDYAEEYPKGETIKWLSYIAKEKNIYLVGGSIPEKDNQNNVYNTSFIFDSNGEFVGKHRKMHLFDIDVTGGIRFKESDVLSSGKELTIFDSPFGKIGVAICYDIRFPELIRLMVLEGVRIIVVPAAFNMTTGPAHWELLFRMRALDNQVYMVGVGPARDVNSSYVSYANSIITDPWGNIIDKLDGKEGTIVRNIDFNLIDKIREELPLLKHRRSDLYSLIKNK